MIDFLPSHDGFRVDFHGRPILEHGRKRPCIRAYHLADARIASSGQLLPGRKRLAKRQAAAWRTIEKHSDYIEIEFAGLGRLSFRSTGPMISLSFNPHDAETNAFELMLSPYPEAEVYGGGERMAGASLVGRRFWLYPGFSTPRRLRYDAEGDGDPSVLIGGVRQLRIRGVEPAYVDFSSRRRIRLLCWGGPKEITITAATETAGLLSAEAERRAAHGAGSYAPPGWHYRGICLGYSGGTEELARRVCAAAEAGVQLGSVYIADWNAEGWELDERRYPGFEAECARYAEAGIRVVLPISPWVGQGCPLREQAPHRFARRADGLYAPRLAEPHDRAWFAARLRELVAARGASGLVSERAVACREAPERGPEGYAERWGAVCAEALGLAGGSEGLFFQAPGWGSAAAAAQGCFSRWPRDLRDGQADAYLQAGLMMGLTGQGAWHPELRSRGLSRRGMRELFMRRVELASFGPALRLVAEEPYWDDRGLMAHLARMSRIWTELGPYHTAVMDEYRTTGLPPMRHPALHYLSEGLALPAEPSYLYGRDLFCSPSYKVGSDLRDLSLPADRWVHLWSSREFRGGEISIEAPLGYPAVFYRADSPWAADFDRLRKACTRFEDPGLS